VTLRILKWEVTNSQSVVPSYVAVYQCLALISIKTFATLNNPSFGQNIDYMVA